MYLTLVLKIIDNRQQILAKQSMCPAFAIGLAGPWICIMGVIFTTHVIVHRLTDFIWIGHNHAINDDHTIRLAQVFSALRSGAQLLRDYYEQLPSSFGEERFYPLAASYKDMGPASLFDSGI